MSDVFEGPGWWLASDGKWYPPHLHHDQAYRDSHAPAAAVVEEGKSMPAPRVSPVPGSVAEMLAGVDVAPDNAVDAANPVVDTQPTLREPESSVVVEPESLVGVEAPVDAVRSSTGSSRPDATPVSTILDRAERQRQKLKDDRAAAQSVENAAAENAAAVENAAVENAAVENAVVENAVAEDAVVVEIVDDMPAGNAPTDTEFAGAPPEIFSDVVQSRKVDVDDSDTAATVSERTEPERVSSSRARLEVGTPPVGNRPGRPNKQRVVTGESRQTQIGMSDEELSTSTDLVPIPKPDSPGPERSDLYDRGVATALFLSGVAMIVGTFMPWDVDPGAELTGWELGDGVATVLAGVLGSAAAGPIFVGFRHIIPKTVAIISGLVGTVVVGLSGLQAVTDNEAAQTSVGAGFWIVAAGSIIMLAAGLADRSALD